VALKHARRKGQYAVSSRITLLFLGLALLLAAQLASNCHADCIACWQLKGVIVQLKDGITIEGYATWNDSWAASSDQSSSVEKQKPFPEVIFDPEFQMSIDVYTHLRSIKYPVTKALVALRDPVEVNVQDIKDLKLNPGPHDGYKGAGDLPLVSQRTADLLQTKPSASCHNDDGVQDVYWVSYDENFPAKELQRLCDGPPGAELEKNFESRDVFSLYYTYD